MNTDARDSQTGAGALSELLRQWRQQSARSGWRVDADWLVPEVEAVATALIQEQSLAGPPERLGRSRSNQSVGISEPGPAERLGRVRSYQGVGVSEAMGDFRALFEVTNRSVDVPAMQQLIVGWVDENEQNLPSSCTDVTTGLATPAHFDRVLHDALRMTRTPANGLVLGSIRFPLLKQQEMDAHWTLLAEMGQICDEAFARRALSQTYQHGELHFLLERTPANLADAIRCQEQLDSLRGGVLGSSELSLRSLQASDAEDLHLLTNLKRGLKRHQC